MEDINLANSADGLDEDSTQDLHTYPDPDTVIGTPWWFKARCSSSPNDGEGGALHPLQTAQSRSPPDVHPDPITGDEHASASDYTLSKEDEISDESLSGLSHSTSGDNSIKHHSLTLRRRGRPPSRGRYTESSRTRGGLPRRSQKGIKRGIRKPLEPSHEFKSLHAQATMAFIDADYETAEQLTLQAILLNPEMYAAHSLLSEIHTARGDYDKALAALFNGAHTSYRNPEPWFTIARLILARADDDDHSAQRDALYCYNRILVVDPGNVDALHQRALLRRTLGYKRRAANDYEHLLRLDPHDVDVLRALAAIYTEMDKPDRAIELYDQIIPHYQTADTEQTGSFSWSDVNIYVELFAYQQRYAEAITKLKSLSRWLLGRRSDVIWEGFCEDDREWDCDDQPRRARIPDFVPGTYPAESYGSGLPLELQIKLGIYRLKCRDRQIGEATTRFELLNPHDSSSNARLYDYPDLFRDVADTLRDTGLYLEALRYYEPLHKVPDFADTSYYIDMAACYRAIGLETEASDCYRNVTRLESDGTTKATILANMELDGVNNNQTTTANSFEKDTVSRGPSTLAMLITHRSHQRRRGPDPSKELRTRLKEETARTLYTRTQDLLNQVREDNPEAIAQWMANSQELVDDFQSHRGFFPSDKGLRVHGLSQGGDNPNVDAAVAAGDYRGIPFSAWLDLILEHALLAARSHNVIKAYEVLKIADDANVFYCSPDSMFLIHVSCALIASDHETSCSVARWFMKEFQFVTDGYRLFSAVNRLCDGGNSWFNCGASQKYVLRQLKAMDHSLVSQSQRRNSFQEKASYTTRDDEGNPIQASEMDLSLLMLYGYILYLGKSYSLALSATLFHMRVNKCTDKSPDYFFRAFALAPTNPTINLSLALAYIQHAFKRQSENRHHLIMQGLTFLFTYYDLRHKSPVQSEQQEANFNVARTYHMLGLTHSAVLYYERCFASQVDPNGDADVGFAIEAAFAVRNIWAADEQASEVRDITSRYLVM
ncbi:MAG: hypothetical protein Q9169_007160 [Polycauliona sp. 2 TL-2023]